MGRLTRSVKLKTLPPRILSKEHAMPSIDVDGVTYELPPDDSQAQKVPQYNEVLTALANFITGGVLISTGDLVVGGDSDSSGTDGISLQTRSTTRLRVNNNGTLIISEAVGFNALATPLAEIHIGNAPYLNGSVLRFNTAQQGTSNVGVFNWSLVGADNAGSSRDNHVMYWGYNISDGGKIISTEPAIGTGLESFWSPSVGNEYFEYHLITYINVAGDVFRPLSFIVNRNTDNVQGNVSADVLGYNSSDGGTQYMIMQGIDIAFPLGVTMHGVLNDQVWMQQFLANGTTPSPLPYWSGNNLIIGNSDVATTGIQFRSDGAWHDDGPHSSVRLRLQTRTTTQTALRIDTTYAGTQTGAFIYITAIDGSDLFKFTVDGQFKSGSGSGGGALDVGWLRSAANTWKATNASSGYGKVDASEFQASGTKVLGARATGWGAPTGTATRTTFATSTVTLPDLAERVKALIDDLTTHGAIGT